MTAFPTKAKAIIFATLIICNKFSAISDRSVFLEIIHAANDNSFAQPNIASTSNFIRVPPPPPMTGLYTNTSVHNPPHQQNDIILHTKLLPAVNLSFQEKLTREVSSRPAKSESHSSDSYSDHTDNADLLSRIKKQKSALKNTIPIKHNQLPSQESAFMRAVVKACENESEKDNFLSDQEDENDWNDTDTAYKLPHHNKLSKNSGSSQSPNYNTAANDNSVTHTQANLASTSKVIRDQNNSFMLTPPPSPPRPKVESDANGSIHNLHHHQYDIIPHTKSSLAIARSFQEELTREASSRLAKSESCSSDSYSDIENQHVQNDPIGTSTNLSQSPNYNTAANDNSVTHTQANLASTSKVIRDQNNSFMLTPPPSPPRPKVESDANGSIHNLHHHQYDVIPRTKSSLAVTRSFQEKLNSTSSSRLAKSESCSSGDYSDIENQHAPNDPIGTSSNLSQFPNYNTAANDNSFSYSDDFTDSSDSDHLYEDIATTNLEPLSGYITTITPAVAQNNSRNNDNSFNYLDDFTDSSDSDHLYEDIATTNLEPLSGYITAITPAAAQDNSSQDDLAQKLKQALAARQQNQSRNNDDSTNYSDDFTDSSDSDHLYENIATTNLEPLSGYITTITPAAAQDNSSQDDLAQKLKQELAARQQNQSRNNDDSTNYSDDFTDSSDSNNDINHYDTVYSESDDNIGNIDDDNISTDADYDSVDSVSYYSDSDGTNASNTKASEQNQLTAESNIDSNDDLPPPSDQDMLQNATSNNEDMPPPPPSSKQDIIKNPINSNILNESQKNAEITDISSKSMHHNMLHHTLLSVTTFKNFISRKIANNDNNALIRPIGASESNYIYNKYAFECKYLYSITTIPHIQGTNQTTTTGILLNLKYQLSNKLTIGTFYVPNIANYKLYDQSNNNTVNTPVTNHCIGVYTSYAITPATYLSNQLSLAISMIGDKSGAKNNSTTNVYPYCFVIDSFLSHKINIDATKTIAPELGLSYYSSNSYTPYNTGDIDNLSLIMGLKFQYKYKYNNIEFCPSIKASHTRPIYSNITAKIQKLSLESISAPSVDFLRDLQSSFDPNSTIHCSLSVKYGSLKLESGYGFTTYHSIKHNYTHTLFVKVNFFF